MVEQDGNSCFFKQIDVYSLKLQQTIADKYEILGPSIAKGDISTIHYANNKINNKKCVLKLVFNDSLMTEFAPTSLLSQLQIGPKIIEPPLNILGKTYIPLEFYNCGSLSKSMPYNKHIPEIILQDLIYQIASQLSKLHLYGFPHANLSPQHILINYTNSQYSFALTGMQFPDKYYLPSVHSAYYSPEALLGPRYGHKPAADIWSLGVIIYELVCGILPAKNDPEFVNKSKSVNVSYPKGIEISKELDNLINQCLKYDAEKRITADQILLHPFLKLCDYSENKIQKSENIESSQKLDENNQSKIVKDKEKSAFNLDNGGDDTELSSKEISCEYLKPEEKNLFIESSEIHENKQIQFNEPMNKPNLLNEEIKIQQKLPENIEPIKLSSSKKTENQKSNNDEVYSADMGTFSIPFVPSESNTSIFDQIKEVVNEKIAPVIKDFVYFDDGSSKSEQSKKKETKKEQYNFSEKYSF